MSNGSFFWFDYETFGTRAAWDRPCQFAGVRTDLELNVIGEPLVVYCRQSDDYLPDPVACKVTGITPQQVNREGVCEAEFISLIREQLALPQTCSVGYNNVRFDDEFTRFTLFRNLFDAYEHEWKNGCSRWDLLDVVRMTRALRPDGLHWPVNEDGSASNRLEHLSVANNIEHTQAHDAMSDVWATIGMARQIRNAQPRLFDYAFQNRGKQAVGAMLNTFDKKPCLQVSGMIPGNRHHLSVIMPLTTHPSNANSVIVLDLHQDPASLAQLDEDEIASRLYMGAEEQAETGIIRPGLRTVQINKCPVLVPRGVLREQDAKRLNIDTDSISRHLESARKHIDGPAINRIVRAMTRIWPDDGKAVDVDGTLYLGGFLSKSDKEKLATIRSTSPSSIDLNQMQFEDGRLAEILWRYTARNYPQSLNDEQRQQWKAFCHDKLTDTTGPWLSFTEFDAMLTDENLWSDTTQELRSQLRQYATDLRQHHDVVV